MGQRPNPCQPGATPWVPDRKRASPDARGAQPPLPLEVVMRGILTIFSQGCKWRAIDRPEACWQSVYQYCRRWVRQGVFTELFFHIERPLQSSRFFLDSTHNKVHRCASHPAGGQASQARSEATASRAIASATWSRTSSSGSRTSAASRHAMLN